MMLGDPGTERHRTRIGLLVLAVGFLLVLWAWGSWLYRVAPGANAQTNVRAHRDVDANARMESKDPVRTEKVTRTLPLFLVVTVVLVLVCLFGGYVLLRAARRYRAAVVRKRAPPSDARDLWAMHKLPPELEDEQYP